MNILKTLWRDERGVIASADLLLIGTICILGSIVGLATLRDEIVQELGDIATAVGQLNQSYSIASYTNGQFSVAGSTYADMADFCELGTGEGSNNNATAGSPPGCIQFVVGIPE